LENEIDDFCCTTVNSENLRDGIIVSIGTAGDGVGSRSEDSVVVAVRGVGLDDVVDLLVGDVIEDGDSCSEDWFVGGVLDVSLDSTVDPLHVLDERVLVVVPFGCESSLCWILDHAQLNGDLEAIRVEIVVILHSTIQNVPVCSIGDSTRER